MGSAGPTPGADWRIVLTQPAVRVQAMIQALQQRGARLQHWPMTELFPRPDVDWPAVCRSVTHAQWLLLPSPGAIEIAFSALAEQGLIWPPSCSIGLVGPGSRSALARWRERIPGLSSARVIEPELAPFDARALLARPELQQLDGRSVVVLRREAGQHDWLVELERRGARLLVANVYEQRALPLSTDARTWLADRARERESFAVSIASSQAGALLAGHVAAEPDQAWLLAQPVLTHHPRIAQSLEKQGWRRVLLHDPGVEALWRTLESTRLTPEP